MMAGGYLFTQRQEGFPQGITVFIYTETGRLSSGYYSIIWRVKELYSHYRFKVIEGRYQVPYIVILVFIKLRSKTRDSPRAHANVISTSYR